MASLIVLVGMEMVEQDDTEDDAVTVDVWCEWNWVEA
ncbi:hypothetical protein M7I_1791 [Glarea lozoyensis 74030]|uniref:Uncharacterized protein n=1 Tax=Glarea lozoyensis (strain ATCC 74030 / MF5533) TaxID=1104152 RepID=H0EH56_GLAL7|nr:hypothetical protein M7I_1791 [Glarea lozoyensis 74030]